MSATSGKKIEFGGVVIVKVHKARNLPKMDPGRNGKLDAYFKLYFEGYESDKQKTKVVKKNFNPKFKETFTFHFKKPLSSFPTFVADCWDRDVLSKDDYAGRATFDLNGHDEWPLRHVKATIALKDGKSPSVADGDAATASDTSSHVFISFNFLPGYHSTVNALKELNTFPYLGDSSKHMIAVDLEKALAPGIFVVLEFEGKKLDLFLIDTNPNSKYWTDVGFMPAKHDYKVRRQTDDDGAILTKKYAPVIGSDKKVYTAKKLDDLDCKTRFANIDFSICEFQQLFEAGMHELTLEHGWKGRADYKKAKSMLEGIETDDKKEALFFPIPGRLWKGDGTPPEWAFLRSDFDSDNIDRTFFLFSEPASAGVFLDLEHKKRTKRTERHFKKEKKVQGRKVVMAVSVDDIEFPCYQNEITTRVFKYKGDHKSIVLEDIVPIFN
eukprot:CAMPEP_0201552566 /NCGR_PEP_ID=MMETSP0173_2-20130828/16790_1 /ASSEMBLY_ACC=CAM_ASM_000268 /TAXON_ID=218659 /ORGANISM="Vexillifera sp., Strain DIVA3 564/2" /LENGTH=438 /DNA_ID=CAMNT_0047963067 /DNA_START=14 /DNA_END=1327 /DNA_ORIENTATION=+